MSVELGGYNVSAPTSALTATSGPVSGLMTIGDAYMYLVAFQTEFGYSLPSPASTAVTTTLGSMSLSGIPVSSSPYVVGRAIYRTAGNGTTYTLLTTIPDNVTTSYVDTIADSSLTTISPNDYDGASSLQVIGGYTQFQKPLLYTVASGITATTSSPPVLAAEYNFVSTVPASGEVMLPQGSASLVGLRVAVVNQTATDALTVVPNSDQTITGSATVAVGTSVNFVLVSPTVWASA